MTATELLAIARKGRPTVRYAVHKNGSAIAAFVPSLDRFVAVASLLIDGKWISMEYELLVNGKPMYGNADWVE